MLVCREFLDSLSINALYFDALHDRCWCATCAGAAGSREVCERHSHHGHLYETPEGWSGFGLALPGRAHDQKVFDNWAVSFHGYPSHVITSILRQGDLLMPGDTLLDSSKLPNRLTRGGQHRIGVYTSPSIRYSELDIYTKPVQWQGHTVRVVLQCRQKMDIRPPELRIEGETIGWQQSFGPVAISQNFTNDEIERFTRARGSIIPYRLLVAMDITTRWQEEEKIQAAAAQAVSVHVYICIYLYTGTSACDRERDTHPYNTHTAHAHTCAHTHNPHKDTHAHT